MSPLIFIYLSLLFFYFSTTFITWDLTKAVHSRAVSQATQLLCESIALRSQGPFSDVGLEDRYVELDLHVYVNSARDIYQRP